MKIVIIDSRRETSHVKASSHIAGRWSLVAGAIILVVVLTSAFAADPAISVTEITALEEEFNKEMGQEDARGQT